MALFIVPPHVFVGSHTVNLRFLSLPNSMKPLLPCKWPAELLGSPPSQCYMFLRHYFHQCGWNVAPGWGENLPQSAHRISTIHDGNHEHLRLSKLGPSAFHARSWKASTRCSTPFVRHEHRRHERLRETVWRIASFRPRSFSDVLV